MLAPTKRAPLQPQRAPVEKVIVAIHGIGEQPRCATVRTVATQFGQAHQLPRQSLGYFSIEGPSTDGSTVVQVSRLDVPDGPLARTGFAEVYWADIPRSLVQAGDTLEETKEWGRTVVSQAAVVHNRQPAGTRTLAPADFNQAAGVIEEIVESVQVLENLSKVAEKMGVFKFDVACLLRNYVDDVQVFTEFRAQRRLILARFHDAMTHIVSRFARDNGGRVPEIHIVAHSEGTVVSFIALLQALAWHRRPDAPAQADMAWIEHVRGFMTLGSPIDKHLLLWERLWTEFEGRLDCRCPDPGQERIEFVQDDGTSVRLALPAPIRWRNYFDLGDPVGYRLDTAQAFLAEHGCAAAFDLHDSGFTRYPLPGAAHTGYWEDAEVFDHFIHDVVWPEPARVRPLKDRPWARCTSCTTPYLVMFLLDLVAVFVLYRTYLGTTGGSRSGLEVTGDVLPLALLLMATTVMARVPRLIRTDRRRWFWQGLALVATASALTVVFNGMALVPKVAVVAAAVAAGMAFWLAGHRLPPRWGRITLVGCATAAGLATIAAQAWHAHSSDTLHFELWPTVLAAGAFVYLSWLALLVFDLSFVWHRYVRNDKAHTVLRQWHDNCAAHATPSSVAA